MNFLNKSVGTFVFFGLGLFLLYEQAYSQGSVVNSKHDLSVSGDSQAKAATESRICVFCHTPHHSSNVAQLWNRQLSTASYIPYSSSTMVAAPDQPTGTSKLCLSCHDGTIALGKTFSDPFNDIQFQGGITTMPDTWDAYLGTNLSNDHPISFEYQSSGGDELLPTGSLGNGVKLDQAGEVQCTSCHNVHDNTNGNFLVTTNIASNLCLSCHDKTGWNSSMHKNSDATWTGSFPNDPDPWPRSEYNTVRENGCGNCHFTHSAPGSERLLSYVSEEFVCYPCHNGKVASTDISVCQDKPGHPFGNDYADPGTHDPTENYAVGQIEPHVECVDCHNAHQTSTATAEPPFVNGVTQRVPGIRSNGEYIAESNYMYEICYKCHGDLLNNVQPTSGLHVIRENDEWDTILEFSPANESFHPVEVPAINSSPSLIGGTDLPETGDVIYCHDCHSDSDQSGPYGPHCSDEEWLLEDRYVVEFPNTYETSDYAICYKCHSESSILADETFTEHSKHIEGENTPCSVCHDPHGVQAKLQGSSSHLINFDTDVVSDVGGELYFIDNGDRAGACVLFCHNEEHGFDETGAPNYAYPESESVLP